MLPATTLSSSNKNVSFPIPKSLTPGGMHFIPSSLFQMSSDNDSRLLLNSNSNGEVEDSIVTEEKMQFHNKDDDLESMKQQFERLEKLVFNHNHSTPNLGGTLDISLSATTITSTSSSSSSSSCAALLEPTPIMPSFIKNNINNNNNNNSNTVVFTTSTALSPIYSPAIISQIAAADQAQEQAQAQAQAQQKGQQQEQDLKKKNNVFHNIVSKLSSASPLCGSGSSGAGGMLPSVSTSSSGLNSEISDDIDVDITQAFADSNNNNIDNDNAADNTTNGGIEYNENGWPTESSNNEDEDDDDDWANGITYDGEEINICDGIDTNINSVIPQTIQSQQDHVQHQQEVRRSSAPSPRFVIGGIHQQHQPQQPHHQPHRVVSSNASSSPAVTTAIMPPQSQHQALYELLRQQQYQQQHQHQYHHRHHHQQQQYHHQQVQQQQQQYQHQHPHHLHLNNVVVTQLQHQR
jgi:hypothetical protein